MARGRTANKPLATNTPDELLGAFNDDIKSPEYEDESFKDEDHRINQAYDFQEAIQPLVQDLKEPEEENKQTDVPVPINPINSYPAMSAEKVEKPLTKAELAEQARIKRQADIHDRRSNRLTAISGKVPQIRVKDNLTGQWQSMSLPMFMRLYKDHSQSWTVNVKFRAMFEQELKRLQNEAAAKNRPFEVRSIPLNRARLEQLVSRDNVDPMYEDEIETPTHY